MNVADWIKCKKPPRLAEGKEEVEKSLTYLNQTAKRFKNSAVLKKLGWNNDFEMFTDRFIEAVNKDPNIHAITAGDVFIFKDYMKVWEKGIHKGFGYQGFVKWKVLEAKLQHLPNGRQIAKQIKAIVNHQRRHIQINEGSLDVINKAVSSLGKSFGVKTADLAKLEADIANAPDEASARIAEKRFVDYLGSLKNGSSATAAGNLFHGIRDVFEGMDPANLKNPDGTPWTANQKKEAKVARNAWLDIRKDMLKVTVNALRMEKEVATEIDRIEGGRRGLTNYLNEIEAKIKELELAPKKSAKGREYDLSQNDTKDLGLGHESTYSLYGDLGYMPHQILRITQHLGEFNNYMYENTISTPEHQFKDFAGFWRRNGTPERAKSRRAMVEEGYSRNPFFFIHKYVHGVSRYNHQRAMQKTLIGVYKTLSKAKSFGEGKVDQKYVEQLIDDGLNLLTGLKEDAFLGGARGDGNGFGMKMTRLFTSLGFIRAMAGSVKTAIKNRVGGEFVNWMEHGSGVKSAAQEYLTNQDLATAVDRELEAYGLLWHKDSVTLKSIISAYKSGSQSPHSAAATRGALEEGFLPPGMKEVKNKAGEVVGITVGNEAAFDKTISVIEKTAGVGSFLHQKVENVLRPSVFRATFAMAHRNLMEMPDWYILQQMGRTRESFQGNDTAMKESMHRWATKEAGKHAHDAVSATQFEYSDVAKADVLTSKKGKVIGQFKHYMFELANWRWKTAQQGLRAIRGGVKGRDISQFSNLAAMRLYRMATGASLATALTTLTGFGINNILQADDIEFFWNNFKLMTADPNTEEGQRTIKNTSFGAGATANLGITFSTMLEFAKLMQWVNINPENKLTMASFTEGEPLDLEDSEWRYRMMRLANLQMSRLMKSVPEAMNANVGKALMYETGMYTSYEDRKRHEELMARGRNIFGIAATGRNKPNQRRQRQLTQDETRRRALQSLALLKT